ncbi:MULTISPECIES: nitroreductase/quinone reductase family protein [unclassified Streptomyces]|uniref:nitroreductase/quinone reductase family protein n=1 Tax=unclassified Streptomyces TaxID=2593676 RepID=UPI0006ADBB23|nr:MULTISPECIES: nitroreductase/quinone reductase family protein [unclassified Streptomyces]KOX23333.1 hypothetical protein ADL06_22435 [Streptomyces sp. NRRL F-6491]KOX42719.1 hypothetical protein ADL08_15195 [Streptomyces sp. NRRL F-6492]
MKVVNPVVRRLAARGKAGDTLLILHFTGRKSGRPFDVPAGYHLVDGRVTVFTNSGWRHNFAGGRDIHVTLHGARRPARAVLVAEPDEVTTVYRGLITELGPAKAQRRLGIRINVDRVPSYDEIREAVTASGLSMIHVTP